MIARRSEGMVTFFEIFKIISYQDHRRHFCHGSSNYNSVLAEKFFYKYLTVFSLHLISKGAKRKQEEMQSDKINPAIQIQFFPKKQARFYHKSLSQNF